MLRIPYDKPYKTIPEQIAILRARGMTVADDALAAEWLGRVGYYRLSGYWKPCSRIDAADNLLDRFRENTTFQHATDLYAFDKELRLLVLEGIETLEVSMRVQLALHLGKLGRTAHLDPRFYDKSFLRKGGDGKTRFDRWIATLEKNIDNSREQFVADFVRKYDSDLPIWMAIEVWDFGLLLNALDGLPLKDVTPVARAHGVPHAKAFISWVKCLNEIRNVCAHHSRLWNRTTVAIPLAPQPAVAGTQKLFAYQWRQTRFYAAAVIIQAMLNAAHPSCEWGKRLVALLDKFPVGPGIEFRNTGFPDDWRDENFWS